MERRFIIKMLEFNRYKLNTIGTTIKLLDSIEKAQLNQLEWISITHLFIVSHAK